MPTLNDMLKDMPQHYNFYLRGVMNSLLPEFMDPFDSEINERNVSGELLEALRLVVNDKYPNLEEGEVQSINYEDVQKFFNESSIFEKNYEIGTVGEQIRTTLGEFGVRKVDGKINIFDTYDFESRDAFDAIKDVFNETRASGSIYPAARFMGGILMPEGPGGKPRPDALKVNITLPEQMQTIDMDYDDDIELDAPTFVFEGPMTNKRASVWKAFTNMFVSEAQAAGITSSNDNLDPRLTRDLSTMRVLQIKGKDPFPMDGDDEYGRMNDAQRAIADESSDF